MAETQKQRVAQSRVEEATRDAQVQTGTAYIAAASLLSEDGGTVVTTASPGEIAQTQTSMTALPDGSIATTVVTTTTVTTTTTTTTTTRTYLTGEIPPVGEQQPVRQLELPVIELESSSNQQRQSQKTQPTSSSQQQSQSQSKTETKSQPQPQQQVQEPSSKPLLYRFVKRAFDIVFSALVVAICFIPGIVLCIVIAASTKGSPFYTQERVGQNGKSFRMLKFRTMVADSDNLEKHFTPKQLKEWHTEHKVKNDPRITQIGQFLRRTSIDEIPNFLNVFIGQMSVVGPRAITKAELHWFGDDVDAMLSVPAGITGWWQVESRNNATFKSGERQKLEMFYVRHASVSLDVHIMLRTVKAMVSGTGN